jgi:hypothetical protein
VPTTVLLTLDTTPPVAVVTLSDAWPGGLLRASYTSDEPIVWAWLELPDGSRVEATVLEDRIEVAIPYDATAGTAHLHYFDDVGNEAIEDVQILGAAPATEVPPSVGGLPGRRARVVPRRHRWHTQIVLRSSYATRQTVFTTSRSTVRTQYRVTETSPAPAPTPPSPPSPTPRPAPTPPAPPPPQTLSFTTTLRVQSTYKMTQPWSLQTTSRAVIHSSFTIQRDDSGEIAFLVALGIV